ncbi:recombinase family protein [Nonomuraea fuscirosea]|uniref:recombinase family protein n=1 Tax=Nonomuraea fuscirosea TaxID=1291556 RepID=UPI00340D41F8
MDLGYGRVSTRDPNPHAQRDRLQAAGCDRTYIDTISGTLSSRPAFDKALDALRVGDVLVFTKLDWLRRSVKMLKQIADRVQGAGAGLRALDQNIDTTTPEGRRPSAQRAVGASATATWNRNRAAIVSWLSWYRTKKHWAAPSVPADAERRKESADETRAVAKTAIHRLLSRRDIPLRERALWRMLYETAARAGEILALNVEDLDLEYRRTPVRSEGGAVEWVYWDSGTAHLLPRLLRLPDGSSRTHGPLFRCPNAAPPAARPPPTSDRTPAGAASVTIASGCCSTPTPGSTCTSCATAPLPTSVKPKSRWSSSWARPGTRTPAPPCATSNPALRPSQRSPSTPPRRRH